MRLLKRVLIFILLKVIEIILLGIVIALVVGFVLLIEKIPPEIGMIMVLSACGIALLVMLGGVIYENWKLAGKIERGEEIT